MTNHESILNKNLRLAIEALKPFARFADVLEQPSPAIHPPPPFVLKKECIEARRTLMELGVDWNA